MSALSELSNGMATAVNVASPSILRVEARRRLPATGIVWEKDGIIITANHIVKRDDKIKVGLADGSSVAATLIGRDPTTDLALLRAETTDLTPFTEANKNELHVGNFVLALGRPGNSVQASLGLLGAKGDSWRTGMGGVIDQYLQTNLVMYPGFSGGPLVDVNGNLIGLNTSALTHGVSIAIPTQTLARVVDSLLAHGHIKRGYLGVNTQQVRLPNNVREELGQKRGLLIVSVEPDSPAEAAGLTLGDTIVGLSGKSVTNHDNLMAQLTGAANIGQPIAIKIVRGAQVEDLEIILGERP